jgi:hypothetical protein
MSRTTFLVFGDLHGRVLPAFRLAQAWSREHGTALAGLLQVGDLDDRPAGAGLLARPDAEADAVFADPLCPAALWFTAGNHEDYDLLKERAPRRPGGGQFPGRCLRQAALRPRRPRRRAAGRAARGGVVGHRRPRPPADTAARPPQPPQRGGARFDVLLTHESPRDAVHADSGSDDIDAVIRAARPAFAFFGHYHRTGRQVEGDFGATRVYHLSHLELDSRAEEASAGVLTWEGGAGDFAYVDPAWLHTVTRSNWRQR